MKAVIVLGSRNINGQTARAADAVKRGLETKAVDVEQFFLPDLRIERCRQCDEAGWGICRTEGRCIIEDDFARVVDALRQANVAVFATPVFFADLSESMKAFTDRLRRTCVQTAGKAGLANKPTIGICVAGGGGGGAPNCCLLMERVLIACGFEMIDLVPVRRQNLKQKEEILLAIGEQLGLDLKKR